MKKLFIIALLFVTSITSAQNTFYKNTVAGCSVLLPAPRATFVKNMSDDGSEVYTTSVITADSSYEFSVICVKLKVNGISIKEQQEILSTYFDYLKPQFDVTFDIGYIKDLALPNDEEGTGSGIKALWTDKNDGKVEIFGWANSNYLMILYIYGGDTYPNAEQAERFFNGLTLAK